MTKVSSYLRWAAVGVHDDEGNEVLTRDIRRLQLRSGDGMGQEARVEIASQREAKHPLPDSRAGWFPPAEASPDIKRHAFTGSCEELLKAGAEKLGFVWTSSFI